MEIVTTYKLGYSFGKGNEVLKNINISVPEGSIYGFLGPNGAGKTTTLRIILGLLRLQKGEVKVFGKSFNKERIEILKSTGSLIEQPSLYQHLTGRENLRIYQLIYQCDRGRINEVLEIVGLQHAVNKKVKQYSLGMKQRLSIAIALLHQPDLLVLDEPSNGLDPAGIVEMRELIKKLNRENNTTILVSSHILSEVEKMATYVGIIHKGQLLFQGTLPELQNLKTGNAQVEIITNDTEKSFDILSGKFEVQKDGEQKILMDYTSDEQVAEANAMLVLQGIKVYRLYPQQYNLENLFMQLTAD